MEPWPAGAGRKVLREHSNRYGITDQIAHFDEKGVITRLDIDGTRDVTKHTRDKRKQLYNGAVGLRYNDGKYTTNVTGKYVSAYKSTRFLKGKSPKPVEVGDYFIGSAV